MATCKAPSTSTTTDEDEEGRWYEQMEAAGFDREKISYTGVNSSLFNGMIAPWAPSFTGGTVSTAVRGAIWCKHNARTPTLTPAAAAAAAAAASAVAFVVVAV